MYILVSNFTFFNSYQYMGSCLDRSRSRQVNGFIGQITLETHGEKDINKIVYRTYLLNLGLTCDWIAAAVPVYNTFLIFGRIHPWSIIGKVNWLLAVYHTEGCRFDPARVIQSFYFCKGIVLKHWFWNCRANSRFSFKRTLFFYSAIQEVSKSLIQIKWHYYDW